MESGADEVRCGMSETIWGVFIGGFGIFSGFFEPQRLAEVDESDCATSASRYTLPPASRPLSPALAHLSPA